MKARRAKRSATARTNGPSDLRAREQQRATTEILEVISSSPSSVQPVFHAIIRSAVRLGDAQAGTVFRLDGNAIHVGAHCNLNTEAEALFRRVFPQPLDDGSPYGRAMLRGAVVNVADLERSAPSEASRQRGRVLGTRAVLAVPMLAKERVVGAIAIGRRAPGAFGESYVSLLKTFAAQAVIAIENVRLFNETKEALEQQTATAEILKVMSSSLTDIQPVVDVVAATAARLCEANDVLIQLRDGDLLRSAAHHGPIPVRPTRSISPKLLAGRVISEGRQIQVDDIQKEDAQYPESAKSARQLGFHTILHTPLIRAGEAIGTITMRRTEVKPFNEKQKALVRTFADQAVIAIENVRLFNETKEALEQQTATAEILQVISSSPTDVQPVFDAIVQSAARLFSPCKAVIVMREGDRLYWKARAEAQQLRADLDELAKLYPLPLDPGRSVSAQAILERRMIHIPDTEAPGVSEAARLIGRAAKHRSMTVVPLLREGEGIGTIAIQHPEPGFKLSDKQLALLRTFADQAVIAIENVRLFNETKEALERQTATSEVLKVISQTRIDLEPVLDIVLKNARRLCGADQAVIFRADGEGNCMPAALQVSERANEIMEFYREHPIRPNRGSATGRAMLERRAIHVPDVLADSEYRMEYATNRNYRSILAVPMLREGSPIGVLTVTRVGEPRPFTDKQIELVTSFADQAVIAIENVRLFNETTEALEQQKASAAILSVISSSIADAKPVFDAILESCERLFEGHYVGIGLVGEDGLVHLAAYHAPYHGRQRQDFEKAFPVPVSNESATGRAILSREVVHYPDIAAADVPIYLRRSAEKINTKSVIVAPMLWESRGVGGIFVGRHTAGPFSEKEIGLLKTFADQAVIAIQNARLFREIHEKSRQLEIANQHKSEFLANMSHELRTPLNAIIGFTRIVMRRAKEQLEPKQYENLEKIHSSGQHLLQLINAILDLSKVEAGRVEVTAADVALGTVLEQCVKTVEPLVKAPAVRLLKEFDGELPQVYLDEEKLRQIVINLLSNAVKFTERGTVRLRAKCNGDGFSVAVADTGIGIPAEKLDHVFEEFAQADASSTRVYGGTGLGLTIARRLARLMGGDISAQSEPGVGSTFTLTLPVRYQALAEVRTEPPAQARA